MIAYIWNISLIQSIIKPDFQQFFSYKILLNVVTCCHLGFYGDNYLYKNKSTKYLNHFWTGYLNIIQDRKGKYHSRFTTVSLAVTKPLQECNGYSQVIEAQWHHVISCRPLPERGLVMITLVPAHIISNSSIKVTAYGILSNSYDG